ncbi:cation:proton antiporter [Emticicia sp. SJ17W-69]|uniref:cation:proton antiporter n=1 Tax=Emticicia sp. SJ17W-69 TaxID=3421657 RepID=UPI003EB8C2B6
MTIYQIITTLVVLSASFAYINKRFLHLPITIGLMLLGTVLSIIVLIYNQYNPASLSPIKTVVDGLDFSKIVLEILLSFLLFAGALHTDYDALRDNKRSVIIFAFVSVLVSTFVVAGILLGICTLFGLQINFLYCLLFGALISPTDPIAVLGILTKANAPKKAEINIVGESLFNDGIGVVIFITFLSIINKGVSEVSVWDILKLFLQEAVGGVVLGLFLGYIIFLLLRSIDDYETEIIITLAAVMGGTWLAQSLHTSGPLAMVVAGLMTGHKSKLEAMSDRTRLYIDKFWHLIDVLMNAILFVLIGLKFLSIEFNLTHLFIGLIALPLLIFARYLSLIIPYTISKRWLDINKKTILLMTWGGLRGGLSIAMALSLSNSFEQKNMFVLITYIVVMFSIFVQGLTIEKVVRRIYGGV